MSREGQGTWSGREPGAGGGGLGPVERVWPPGVAAEQLRRRGEPRRIVIGVSLMNLSSEFIAMLNQAMEAKARELDVELIVNDAQRSAERQVQQVEGFIVQHVDAIILNPCEVEASSPAVDKALAAGIPIVNVNSETTSEPTAFVGSRDEESARLAMEYIAKRLQGQGPGRHDARLPGPGGAAETGTRAPARVLAKYPGLTLLADQTAEWDRAKAMTLDGELDPGRTATRSRRCSPRTTRWDWAALMALEQAKLKDR